MFEFLENDYAWALACQAALGCGANINDIDRALKPCRALSETQSAQAQQVWWQSWSAIADEIEEVARDYEKNELWLSAQHAFRRASAMHSFAERMLPLSDERKITTHAKSIESLCASEYARMQTDNSERFEYVHFPYKDKMLAGYLYLPRANTPAPCAVALNGFDSTKEIAFLCGFAASMAARGIASLIIDQPGTGEALRKFSMPLEIESEHAAGAAFDFAASRNEIDENRVAIVGQSLGGYFAPRAAAMDPRFAACIAWGAFYSMERYYADTDLQAEGMPGVIEYALTAYGVRDEDELREKALKLTLAPVLAKIKVPFLCAHGANDRQTSLDHGYLAVEAAVNSPATEVHAFNEIEGAAEHCGLDNFPLVVSYMADWLAKHLNNT